MIPAQSKGAAPAGSSPAGMRNTKDSLTTMEVEYPP